MPTLQLFFPSLFFLIFLPGLGPLGADTAAVNCSESACSSVSPKIRFPFRLEDQQPSRCGYPGFDLTCDPRHEWITTFTLPSSGGHFIVHDIDYWGQILWIMDPDNCFPRRVLENDFMLTGLPFAYAQPLESFTFLKCSQEVFPPILCLSNGEDYVVSGVPSKWVNNTSSNGWEASCSAISTAMVPFSDPFEWDHLNGFKLAWDVPDCHFCENIPDKVCGSEINGTSLNITCSDAPKIMGLPWISRYMVVICSVGITAPLLTTVFALFLRLRARDQVRQRQLTRAVELSATVPAAPQPPIVVKGLDDPTIDSFLKTQLGEGRELPEPNDNTCSICLGNYKLKEVLRIIPKCDHYFHATCIDEWLRRNATCPICRNPPEGNRVLEP